MAESEFEMSESFEVDNGKLDDLTAQECFVLGYELCAIVKAVEKYDQELNFIVHSDNMDRMESFIKNRGRQCKWTFPSDDISESWVYLKVLVK